MSASALLLDNTGFWLRQCRLGHKSCHRVQSFFLRGLSRTITGNVRRDDRGNSGNGEGGNDQTVGNDGGGGWLALLLVQFLLSLWPINFSFFEFSWRAGILRFGLPWVMGAKHFGLIRDCLFVGFMEKHFPFISAFFCGSYRHGSISSLIYWISTYFLRNFLSSCSWAGACIVFYKLYTDRG